jgi:hypothetical protein
VPTPLNITTRFDKPNSFSPVQQHHQPPYIPSLDSYQSQGSAGYYSIVEPNGCFVPTKTLSFIQKTDITRHHYVIPTFAMVSIVIYI